MAVEMKGTDKQPVTPVEHQRIAWTSQNMSLPVVLVRQPDMHAYSESVRQLVDGVRRAFWEVSYPGDDRLLADDSYDLHELSQLQFREWNFHWTKVPHNVVERHANSLPFLSPEAYRFFLPAFIIYSLEKPESSVPVLPYLVYDLMNTAERKRDCYRRRLALLSPDQEFVVLGFLRYVRDELRDAMCSREADIAIESYWGGAGGREKGDVTSAL